MAYTAATQWELRPDGGNANGMLFDSSFGGTDYSQQSSPQVSVTDGVTNGTTTVTSATAGFTPAMVGNGINIGSDNLYQITVVVSSTQVTVDRNTLNGGSGRTLKVGGAGSITTHGFDSVFYGKVAGNKTWIRATNSSGVATSYSPTTAALTTSPNGTGSNPTTYEGYSTVRGDGGRPQIVNAQMNSFTYNSNSVVKNLFINSGASGWGGPMLVVSGSSCMTTNVQINSQPGSGGLPRTGISNTGTGNVFRNVLIDGGSISSAVELMDAQGNGGLYINCEFRNGGAGSGGAVILGGGGNSSTFQGCLWNNNKGACVRDNTATTNNVFRQCIFWGTLFDTNTFPGDAIQITSSPGAIGFTIQNCIFGSSAGVEVNSKFANDTTSAGMAEWMKGNWTCNWFYDTGTGRYNQLPANPNDNTLSVVPFTNPGGGDFTLNSLTNGGALLASSPCSTAFVDGINSSNTLAGFYGTVPTSSDTVSMRSLWREINNQRSTLVVPDATVDLYLDGGLQEINRQVAYYYVTDSTSLTLTANQQEISLPVDVLEVVWVKWNGQRLLEKGSIEQWTRLNDDWQGEPAGIPRFWAHYANVLVLRPAPSAAAVAGSSALTFRYVSTPPSISTSGPVEADHEMQRLAVYWATWAWVSAYPDSQAAQQRGAAYKTAFDEGMTRIIERYARRGISR